MPRAGVALQDESHAEDATGGCERELRRIERASAQELLHGGAALEQRGEEHADDQRADHGDGAERHHERHAALAGAIECDSLYGDR